MNFRNAAIWEKAAKTALLLLAFSLPLSFHANTFDVGLLKDLTLHTLAAAAAAFWLMHCLETGRFAVPVPRGRAAALGFAWLAWILLSSAWNPYPQASLFGALRLAAFAALFLTVLLGPASASFGASLSGWTLLAAGTVALYALAQSTGAAPLEWSLFFSRQSLGTMLDPNLLGVFLACAAPIGLARWADSERRTASRALGLAAALLASLGVAVSGSPPGALALAAGCVCFAVWGHLHFRHQAGRAAVIAAWAAPLAAALASRFHDPDLGARILSGSLLNKEIWAGSTAMLSGHLWTGAGAGAFNAVFPAYRPTELMNIARVHNLMIGNAHSEPLQIACELGLIGLALWCAIIATTLRSAWKDMSRRAADGEERAAALMAGQFAALIALLAAGAISSTLRSAAPGAFFWLLAGSLAGLASERGSAIVRVLPIPIPIGFRRILYIPLASILAVGGIWEARFFRSDISLNEGIHAAASKDWRAALDGFGRVSAWHSGGVLARYLAAGARAELGGRDNLEQALAAYEEVGGLSPNFFLTSFRKAGIRKDLGDWQRAEQDLAEFISADGSYAPAYALLAEVSTTLGKPQAARDAALQLVRLDPKDSGNWRLLAEQYHAMRNHEAARRMFDRADSIKDLAQARPRTPSLY